MMKTTAFLAAILFLLASETRAQDNPSKRGLRISEAAFVTAQVFDVWTTDVGLDRGGVEANPLMVGSNAKRIAIKAVGTAAVLGLMEAVDRRGKPKAAKVALWVMTAATVGVGAHNLSVHVTLK